MKLPKLTLQKMPIDFNAKNYYECYCGKIYHNIIENDRCFQLPDYEMSVRQLKEDEERVEIILLNKFGSKITKISGTSVNFNKR